ncbi:MAG: hypothetical protein E7324_04220 [Clostridiales bacterium]|nr:hypothetical protein [Clostridiales bacterium]
MSGWAFFFFAAGLATSISLLLMDRKRRQMELVQMNRMRNSQMYYDLYRLVKFARAHQIDRVQVERHRIVFYTVHPPEMLGAFFITDLGYPPLTRQQIRSLTLVLAEDLPLLQERRCYRLRGYRTMRPNGIWDDAYQYTITSHYKTQLVAEKNRVWVH